MSTLFNEVKNEEAMALIDAINPHIDISPFQIDASRVLKRALPFYKNTSLIEITDHKDKQPRQILSLIQHNSGNQNVHILDWSPDTIYRLNDLLGIILHQDNISAYVRFFFSMVRSPEGQFKIVDTPEHINWRDEPTTAAKRALSKMIDPLYLINKDASSNFYLGASLVYKQSLFASKISVTPKGVVEVYEQELLVDDIPITEAL
ncbi:MAG: hypothetical protein GW903_06145 [Alphaproteobacteria bacterium]|nr:hypothetical protein [Alphaproteobacteria bacterium]NCQ88461.1 hypothetical protein [Alphaproteobacteria bacterium]NCT06004.1 hypothetical protein [Alphaproteobacteria bacterium]